MILKQVQDDETKSFLRALQIPGFLNKEVKNMTFFIFII